MNAAITPIASNNSGIPFPQYNSGLHHRLDGWKEISLYLKRSVRCVQRWERNECLPVHRHKHLHGTTVYAFRYELDAWWQNDRRNPAANTNSSLMTGARQSTTSTVPSNVVNSELATAQPESPATSARPFAPIPSLGSF